MPGRRLRHPTQGITNMTSDKIIVVVVLLSVGAHYGLLYSKFGEGNWTRTDIVSLVGMSVSLAGAVYVLFSRIG